MKTRHFLIALMTICMCYSCNNEAELDEKTVSSSEQSILKFATQAEFEAQIKQLGKLDDEELAIWSKQQNFRSLEKVYADVIQEITVAKTADDYLRIKEEYKDMLFFPEENEDFGPYLPLINEKMGHLLNSKGEVIIADQIVNLKDITSYKQLQQLNRSIPQEGVQLRTTISHRIGGMDPVRTPDQKYTVWADVYGEVNDQEAQSKIEIVVHFKKYVETVGWVFYSDHVELYGGYNSVDSRGNSGWIYKDVISHPNEMRIIGVGPTTFTFPWPECYTPYTQREYYTTETRGGGARFIVKETMPYYVGDAAWFTISWDCGSVNLPR